MNLLCLILLVSAVVLWFSFAEYDSLFGVYYPTCAIRHRNFLPVVFAFMCVAIIFSTYSGISDTVSDVIQAAEIDCRSTFVLLLSSFITLLALRFFSIRASVCYALLGSLVAYMYAVGDGYSLDWSFALSFVSAPILSLIFAFILSLIFKSIFSHLDLHLIKLAYYMRTIVVICIIFTAIAIGFNWGGFIIGLGSALEGETQSVALVTTLAATAIAAVMMILNRRNSAEYSSGVFADFSIYSVLSVGFAVVTTLMFFSFDTTTSLVHLSPVPLSASTLIMAAIGGVELAQRLPLVDREEYMNEATGFIIAPLGSFMLTHILISVIDADVHNQLDDFAVLAVAVAVLMALAFAGYVRMQRRQKEATDKLVYTQQQQIYENSRALNDMELKVVLSENQALHNAVEMKKQEVINVALSIVEQREYLESLNQIVARLSKTDDTKEKDNLIAELKSSLNQRLSYDRDVDSQYFYAQAESLHEDFNAKLSENFPDLTPQERRLATLLRLGFSSKYIATLMNITPKSVEISRYRLRQKLGLEKGSNLVNFIKSI